MLHDLPVIHQTLSSAFSSESRFLVPAKRGRRIELVEGICPDSSSLEQGAHLENARALVGPHARRQSVHRVVRLFDGFLERPKSQNAQNGAEDLFARDAVALRHASEYG